ncbi:hypothetical protein Tco_0532388 [Tanacetum coccineum]
MRMLTLGELSMIMARISSRNDPTLCFDDDDVLSVLSLDISMKLVLAWNEASNSIILSSCLVIAIRRYILDKAYGLEAWILKILRYGNQVTVGRCNKKTILPNIPCPKECRIVGQILVDHAIRYGLTDTADVLAIYIQQFWRTVKQVLNDNETIRFMVDKEDIIYTIHMFRATLKLPIETAAQPFIPPANFDYIWPFLKIFGYQGQL